MMTLLTNMADKELVHMIAWAKKIPGTLPFNSTLMALLQCPVSLRESTFISSFFSNS